MLLFCLSEYKYSSSLNLVQCVKSFIWNSCPEDVWIFVIERILKFRSNGKIFSYFLGTEYQKIYIEKSVKETIKKSRILILSIYLSTIIPITKFLS